MFFPIQLQTDVVLTSRFCCPLARFAPLLRFGCRRKTNITLSSLDLSWNSVRMASGVSLGQSLAHNSALTELKLAHNSLADPGIQAVSEGLSPGWGCFTERCVLLNGVESRLLNGVESRLRNDLKKSCG